MTKSRDTADSINRIDSSAADATAITIDASENVLVGTTTLSTNTDGHELRSDGKLVCSTSGAAVAYFNRNTDNGQIIRLDKDGTTVGSIGIDSGGFYVDGEANHTGLRFKGGAVTPRLNGAQADNTVGLGNATERFSDLYLGGSLFVGGTGSANELDDYEEGTWTPTYYITGATFSMGLQVGTYVKIGRMVHATARVRGQRSGGSGVLLLTGLPFTTESTTNINAACSIGFTNGWSASPKGAITGNNATSISFRKSGSTSALSNIVDDITHSDVSTSSTSSNDLILSVTYRTS